MDEPEKDITLLLFMAGVVTFILWYVINEIILA